MVIAEMIYVIIFTLLLGAIFWFKNRKLPMRQAVRVELEDLQTKLSFTAALAKLVSVLIAVVLSFIAIAMIVERVF